MKFTIAPQFTIGARKFRIVFNDFLLAKMRDDASANMLEQIVRLPYKGSASGIKVTPEAQFELLLHEIEHTINVILGINASERDCTSRATLLAQALISLGLEPDFSQITEEKRVE